MCKSSFTSKLITLNYSQTNSETFGYFRISKTDRNMIKTENREALPLVLSSRENTRENKSKLSLSAMNKELPVFE